MDIVQNKLNRQEKVIKHIDCLDQQSEARMRSMLEGCKIVYTLMRRV